MNTNIPVMLDWTIPTSSDEVEQLKETIDELVMSDNMELDKLVEEVLNVLKRINNTENITKGE